MQRETDVVLAQQSGPPLLETRDAGALCDMHASALFGLAVMILGDREEAEYVTRHAILACSGPVHVAQGADRRELAGYVYVRCLRELRSRSHLREVATQRSERTEAAESPWVALSGDEAIALALGLFGEQTYQEIAGLLNVPPSQAAALLRSGLQALGQAL